MGKIKQEEKRKKWKKKGWDQIRWISREKEKKERNKKKREKEKEQREKRKKGFHFSLRSTEFELSVFFEARIKFDPRIASYV